MEWPNGLPKDHLFQVDHNLMGAERGLPVCRTIVHVHGLKALQSPMAFPKTGTPQQISLVRYPNEQSPAMLWYHDHAMGITRLNTYAGLAGLYIVRDAYEDALGLPSGLYEIPLVLMDRMFTTSGQLYIRARITGFAMDSGILWKRHTDQRQNSAFLRLNRDLSFSTSERIEQPPFTICLLIAALPCSKLVPIRAC